MRVNKKTLGIAINNLAFLVDAGIDVLTAVTIIDNSKDKHIKCITKIWVKELSAGNSLGKAFSMHEHFFGRGYSEYIEAGAKSGELGKVLLRVSKNIAASGEIKKQIQNVMIYPAFLLVLTIVASFYMFTTIVPQMAVNIKELSGSELPSITQWVLNISDVLINNKMYILFVVAIVAFCIKIVAVVFADELAKAKVKIPVIGGVVAGTELIEYYANLSRLLEAEIPMSEALSICNKGFKNSYLKNSFAKQTEKQQSQGKPLGEIMATLPGVSVIECQCIAVAEQTGKLPSMLTMIAEQKQTELKMQIKTMLSFVEPGMLLLMGGVIGLIVLSVYLPMLSMTGF